MTNKPDPENHVSWPAYVRYFAAWQSKYAGVPGFTVPTWECWLAGFAEGQKARSSRRSRKKPETK